MATGESSFERSPNLNLWPRQSVINTAPTHPFFALILCRRDREHPERTSTALHNLERRRNHHRTRRGKLVEVAQAREPELARSVHDRVIREWRCESASLSRISADCFHANAEHIPILREERRGVLVEAGAVWSVLTRVDERSAISALAPSRAQQHPCATRNFTVLLFPRFEMRWCKQIVFVLRHFGAHINHARGADELLGGNRGRRVVGRIFARNPVHRCIEMRAGVLAHADRVPIPTRTLVVIMRNDF